MRTFNRVADRLADSFAFMVGTAIVLAAAVYPVVFAVRSGAWWAILVAVVVIGIGAAAMAYAAID